MADWWDWWDWRKGSVDHAEGAIPGITQRGYAKAWITPRTKGYVVKYDYYHGVVSGWIRLLQDPSVWVHFHSRNFKMTCKDELHALAEDEQLGLITVSFFIDEHTHQDGGIQPTAMAIMPDPELTWGTADPSMLSGKQAVYSNKWWNVMNNKWWTKESKKRKRQPQPPGYPPQRTRTE